MHGRAAAVDHRHNPVPSGYDYYAHVAIDDHSRWPTSRPCPTSG